MLVTYVATKSQPASAAVLRFESRSLRPTEWDGAVIGSLRLEGWAAGVQGDSWMTYTP